MWEYHFEVWGEASNHDGTTGTDGLRRLLNDRGRHGWELVSVLATGAEGGFRTFYFKRPQDATRLG